MLVYGSFTHAHHRGSRDRFILAGVPLCTDQNVRNKPTAPLFYYSLVADSSVCCSLKTRSTQTTKNICVRRRMTPKSGPWWISTGAWWRSTSQQPACKHGFNACTRVCRLTMPMSRPWWTSTGAWWRSTSSIRRKQVQFCCWMRTFLCALAALSLQSAFFFIFSEGWLTHVTATCL